MGTVAAIVIYTVLVFATSAIGSLTGIGGGVIRKPVFDLLGDFNASEIAFLNVVTILAMSLVSILRQSKNFCFVPLFKKPLGAKSLGKPDSLHEEVFTAQVRRDAIPKSMINGEADCQSAVNQTVTSVTPNAIDEKKKPLLSLKNLLFLAVGSVFGGVSGEVLFAALVKDSPDTLVKLVQNAVLLAFIVLVLVYMLFEKRIPTAKLKHFVWFISAGFFLGILASFLGIGGGPMNLAVLMLLFSMSLKEAAYSSLVIILVSQVAKLIVSAITGTILVVTAPLVYTSVAFLTIGAVAGGFVGSFLSKKFTAKTVKIAFNLLQLVLIGIVIYNIIQYS